MAQDAHTADEEVKLAFLTASRKGTSVALDHEGDFRLGRDPVCEIHLPEPNVSRTHARMQWDGSVLSIEDLSSTNGIFVNGEKVTSGSLHHLDVVAVGPAVFRVELPAVTSHIQVVGRREPIPDDEHHEGERDRFQSLFECMLAIQRILSEDKQNMLDACLDTLFLALPVTRICLLRVSPTGDLEPWLTRTRSGISHEFIMSKTFARKVREAGKGILIHDALYLDSAEWGNTMQQQEVRSILGVPVFDQGTGIAILLCDNLEHPNILRDMHVRTLEFFAKALETVFQRERIHSLQESQVATERQFLAAQRVQKQIFTKKPSEEMGGMRWAFHFRPALEVGGDFYDFHEADGAVTWVVADVTGKGISAALVVSMLKGLCKTLFPKDLTPKQILVELNELILDELPPEMFLTVQICTTTPNGMVRHANAGHLPLLVAKHTPKAKGEEVVRLKPPGVPLGFLAQAEFASKIVEQTYQLERGDRMCLCTDGITEAQSADSVFFGEKRLIAELADMRGASVAEGVDALVSSVMEFQGSGPQHDDVTVVIAEYPQLSW
jgi:phosphoserine phosphatase RsbU/P